MGWPFRGNCYILVELESIFDHPDICLSRVSSVVQVGGLSVCPVNGPPPLMVVQSHTS